MEQKLAGSNWHVALKKIITIAMGLPILHTQFLSACLYALFLSAVLRNPE